MKLEQLTQTLSTEKQYRAKQVASFLRTSKKIEKIQEEVDNDYFEEEKEYVQFGADTRTTTTAPIVSSSSSDNVTTNGTAAAANGNVSDDEDDFLVDSLWESTIVGDATERGNQAKLRRLQYRDEQTQHIHPY